ncbi:hypothetical protein M2323_000338 [Rhodoblastus acidophilus]|uniref:DUF6338 family protein n=1 Tax=Rhodoblastus acidophilus TaxID=1074 RepID=UPI0022248D3B|nr:DUF6338 family protein [Rhodoblastus acidophilus]MCW2282577.1 hypothetical protein [Rhodoblastus acidophilus]MCW2331438.1 hypothetical protein [Rhodoblastus acidophilus]
MKIDLLILQLAVIFLPGIIWARIDARYAAKQKPSDLEFIINAFLFGVVTYVAEFALFRAFNVPFKIANFKTAATDEIIESDILAEVGYALIIGFVLSILWLYVQRHKLLTQLLQKIRATKKYGDEDVWDFTFNSNDIETEFVHFRDFEHELVYAGFVNMFSETDKLRELVLLDVIVYNFDGEEVYKSPRLYVACAPESAHIEFPYVEAGTVKTETPQ